MTLETQETSISQIISDLNSRIRILEGRYNLFGERLIIINKNMIEEYRKLSKSTKSIDEELQELRRDIEKIKDVLKDIIKELQSFAKKDSLKILEKYINMWNPLNFTTTEDVKKIIGEEIGRTNTRSPKTKE